MAARIHALVAATALIWAGAASAKIYAVWQPRATITGGFNDNVQLDGTGSDGFGQLVPGLKLQLFGDHQLHLDLDCQAGLAHLMHPDRFEVEGSIASNESCYGNFRSRLSPRNTLRIFGNAAYAQDPFAIAGYGLLLRPGQGNVFVGHVEADFTHATSPRGSVELGLFTQMLAFGAGDPGNGYMLAPHLRYSYRTTSRQTWDVGVREQFFLGVGAEPNPLAPRGAPGGLLSVSHTAQVGWTYQINHVSDVSIRGGPLFMNDNGSLAVQPTVHVEIGRTAPSSAVRLIVGHDVAIGANTAGPLIGDIAELQMLMDWTHWAAHGRAGVYRNGSIHESLVTGLVGYSAEAVLDWKFAKEWRLGVAALRDARLNDPVVGHLADRDVVQLRLTWEQARF